MANWQEDELLLTLHLYCRTAFGKLHNRNPDVIQLAEVIGRTVNAVALKATKLASLDQSIPQTGMSNTNKADRALWNAFIENSTEVATPTNGIALNALYDKAFDRHLISFDDEFRLVLSDRIKKQENNQMIQEYFLGVEGKALEMPRRFLPDREGLKAHRTMLT